MQTSRAPIDLISPYDTARAAKALGAILRAGDTILLSGPVGAGKTHFARHLIQSLLIAHEDVPSPTFTLVQTYETGNGPLWHADLYRVGSVHEIEELGLTDAFKEAICLIEWPDRLGPLTPEGALSLLLEAGKAENARLLTASWNDPLWSDRLQGWGGV
ncbi:MAG: tRNA (adenosine(37)-N6)-threonylcarbamoyltransferase complex ATPase subunit type 1 TsaE [Pseudomonadota bacterium]